MAQDDLGRAAKLLIDALAVEGFGERIREWEELWHLTITGVHQGRSGMTVMDDGHLRWEYESGPGPDTSPAAVTRLIMRLLHGVEIPGSPPRDDAFPHFTLKGAVGRLLQDQGLKVELLTYEDLESFDVVGEIQVANPAWPGRGRVRLTDNGDIEWECHTPEAFGVDAGPVVGVIAPVLREGLGPPPRHRAQRDSWPATRRMRSMSVAEGVTLPET